MPVLNSIQRGTIGITAGTNSATATISPVTPGKTELRYLGGSGIDGGAVVRVPRLELTNSTTITANMASASSGTTTVSWELTEWQ